jgi:hypothetical protein
MGGHDTVPVFWCIKNVCSLNAALKLKTCICRCCFPYYVGWIIAEMKTYELEKGSARKTVH